MLGGGPSTLEKVATGRFGPHSDWKEPNATDSGPGPKTNRWFSHENHGIPYLRTPPLGGHDL